MTGTRCASLAILFVMTTGNAADGTVRRSTQAVTRTVWDGVYLVAQALPLGNPRHAQKPRRETPGGDYED